MHKPESAAIAAAALAEPQDISTEVLIEKYAKGGETTIEQVITCVSKALADIEQPKLLRMGIASTIYGDRKGAEPVLRLLPDGKGGSAPYMTRVLHELCISGDNMALFAERIGFADTDKQHALECALTGYRRALNRERFTATIDVLEPDGEEAVFDVQIPGINAFDANGLYVHNCGEQPLPDYGCCCLGSLNLTAYVQNPFTPEAKFDFDLLEKVTKLGVRMLDNVLIATKWPLPEQAREADAKRRLGLGFTGLGDALIMLGIRYDSEEGRMLAADISRVMRDAAYESSVELAQERGAFPLFDAANI